MKISNVTNIFLSISLAICSTGCGSGEQHGENVHSQENHDHESETIHGHDDHDHDSVNRESAADDEIVFESSKARDAGVNVEKVTPGVFSEIIHTSGKILLSGVEESTVVATQPGIVKMTKSWSPGMPVSKGMQLISISQSQLPGGALSTRASIDLKTALSNLKRVEELYNRELATASEYEEAKSAYENARLSANALSAGGNGNIISPRTGYVLQCLVKDGDYVDVGTPLMTVTSTRRMRLQADLPIRNYGDLSKIVSANFRLPQNETLYRLDRLNGRLVSHSPIAEGNSAYISVIFEFDNAPGVVAGSFADVYLVGSQRSNVISVPKKSLVEEQGLYFVYIRVDRDGYLKRKVEKGAADGERIVIHSGLKPGDLVVTSNPMAVKLAGMSGAIPGHSHEH